MNESQMGSRLGFPYGLVSITSLIWMALDQVTKLYVHSSFELGESITAIPGLFNITYVKNFGAAFGFLANSHPILRGVLLYSLPPIAAIIILTIIRRDTVQNKFQTIALSSILGGAMGNFFDRVRLGFVVDYLDFHLNRSFTWPAFNFADVAIVLGVFCLMIISFRDRPSGVSN